ncbi:UvrD-helicase domain-containing protein [Sandaracinus amylolyticus]|uniref:UvrD-helicase domain-containing protein n=1 Tax=Sandaracinus amylolyticus TaxID=927083 RepID=UPI00069DE19F|nr:UvrD-helicase domain-containing protein [Sandaracinus amylolyticus]
MTDVLTDRPALLDALRRADGSRPHAVIEASAGTGKTHTLEHLVIDLLREGTPIERILVVTFTEKATLEMRARIRARIASLVTALSPVENERLRAALLDFDRAPISTIHAFCQRVLAEQAFASGRLLEQQRLDPREAFAKSFRDALRRGLAANAPERPLLEQAIAAMGASKLEDVLWRWSLERGEVRPRFDAESLVAAIAAMPDAAELEGALGRTLLHSVGHHAVRARARETFATLAPFVAKARAAEPVDAWLPSLLAWANDAPNRAAERNVDYLAIHLGAHPVIGAHVRTLAAHASSALPVLIGRVLPAIVKRLDEDKRKNGRFDFDDMLRLVHEALHGPRGDDVTAALRARYRYALVDEFQDTDPVQWAIFRRVFFDREDGGALVLIGDPKQSIYAFRSADVHTYLAVCDEVVAAGGVKVPLVDCYRSTQPMIDAVNLVLRETFFTGPNRYDHPVRCGRPALVAEDATTSAPIVLLHLHADDELRAKPMRFALANAIADEIARLIDGGMQVTDRSRDDGALRPLQPSDVFVLTRTGKEAQEVAEALRRRGIPHALSSQEGLFDTREARDVLDVLRALEDPGSRALRLRAWMTPFFAVTQDELDACRALPGDHPFALRIARWTQLARDHRFAALFQSMLDESGLARRLLFLREGERELVNYQHVLEILLARASQGRLALREITTELGELVDTRRKVAGDDEDVQRLESERAAVQLLTMHKSKGLEAEVVFLFGGMTQRPAGAHEPHVFHEDGQRVAWIGDPGGELGAQVHEEERHEHERLLYVALTRARSRSYLPYIGPAPARDALPAGTGSTFARLAGAYRVLADRLVQLVDRDQLDPALFARSMVKVTGARRRIAIPAPLPAIDATTTSAALTIPALDPPERFTTLRGAARGIEVTSYTRMKAGRARLGLDRTHDDQTAWIEELASDATAAVVPIEADDPLPAGAAFGVFVHEILEHVDVQHVIASADRDALLAHEPTSALFAASAERNGIDPRVIPPSAELVMRTLKTPIRAGTLALPEGFASLTKTVAEMSFLHPIPERAHPLFGDWQSPDRAPLTIERGFVRGVIDLIFEHAGRIYVLDWKTDRLPTYDAASLEAHVAAHYEIQARLYALGVARMLRIASASEHDARFGGIVYCFVRGMKANKRGPTEGVTFARPTFDTLAEWDRALRDEDAPWGHPLPPRPRREEARS